MGRMQFFGNFDDKKENYCTFFYRIWSKKAILKECYDNEKMGNPHDRMGQIQHGGSLDG